MQKVSTEAMQKFMVWLQDPLSGRVSEAERITIERVVRRRDAWVRLVWRYNAERVESLTGRNPKGHQGVRAATPKGVGMFLEGTDGPMLLRAVCQELSAVSIGT